MFKKMTLSLATASILVSVVNADDITTIYQDPDTGVLYGTENSNFDEFQDFKNAKELDREIQDLDSKLTKLKMKFDSSKAGKLVSVEKKGSPEFALGKYTGPNFKIKAQDNSDMYVKLGARIQSTFENRTIDKGGNEETYNDAYLRRTRFEITTGFDKYTSFTMDVRNDKANYQDDGEKGFNVGDAYLKIKKPFGSSLVNFKLYRGKIDVSRTETVKSAYVIHYDRPAVADEAAQYITHNRRGTNAQMYGDWNKKIHYQVAIGDGVYSGKMKDATGSSYGGDVTQESFFYGGKVVLSPIDGWEEKHKTETYFGKGQHFSIGGSYWNSSDIVLDSGDTIDHELLNIEVSAHYKGLFVGAEYFQFDGVANDWDGDSFKTGTSDGFYVTGEYMFDNHIAPFFRYESWNKWEGEDGYDFTSTLFGANWYLRGYTTKIGLVVQNDDYDDKIGDKTDQRFKLTTQWFF